LLLDTRNKNIYSLGVGISTVFKIFSYFNFLGVGLISGVMTYITIGYSLTKGTRIYIWLRSGDLNDFRDI
jgi:hypothetical protein